MEITLLRKKRSTLRGFITSTFNKIDSDIKLSVLHDKGARLFELDKVIWDTLAKDEKIDEVDVEEELESTEHYREIYYEIIDRMSKLNVDNQKQLPVQHDRKFKLPALEWVTFDGDIKNWIIFWGQFSKIDSDSSIPDEDKYLYLLQATSGKAKRLVQTYPPSAENYGKALDQLKKRFAREECLIEFYVRQLIELIVKGAKVQQTLGDVYDVLRANVNNLDSLGLRTKSYSCIILPLIESCLP